MYVIDYIALCGSSGVVDALQRNDCLMRGVLIICYRWSWCIRKIHFSQLFVHFRWLLNLRKYIDSIAAVKSALSFAKNTKVVTAMMWMVLRLTSIAQSAAVAEAWILMTANCKTSCHLMITTQQAISTSHDISLAVVITSSIIQCSYDMHQDIVN